VREVPTFYSLVMSSIIYCDVGITRSFDNHINQYFEHSLSGSRTHLNQGQSMDSYGWEMLEAGTEARVGVHLASGQCTRTLEMQNTASRRH